MTRRLASLAIVASLLFAAGACSKAADTGTTNTQAPPTTAAKSDTTTAASSDTKSPGTTAKSTGTTAKSTGTTRKGGSTGTTGASSKGLDLSAEQTKCVETALQGLVQTNPEAVQALAELGQGNPASLTQPQAVLIGGLIVECVPKPELVDSLIAGLKSSPDGASLSSEGLDCIRTQVLALDSDELALFIATLAYASTSGDRSIAAPVISKLNSACNTSIPA